MSQQQWLACFFFFNDTATTEIYTLSLHDALPIYIGIRPGVSGTHDNLCHSFVLGPILESGKDYRSEEHTSELQSQSNLVCRLLLEKKKDTSACAALRHCSALPSSWTYRAYPRSAT